MPTPNKPTLFMILTFLESQSQLYRSQLLLQLIFIPIPNLSCLLPIGPFNKKIRPLTLMVRGLERVEKSSKSMKNC